MKSVSMPRMDQTLAWILASIGALASMGLFVMVLKKSGHSATSAAPSEHVDAHHESGSDDHKSNEHDAHKSSEHSKKSKDSHH